MSKYQIIYYNAAIMRDIESLPKTLQAKYVQSVTLMVDVGANLGMPHTKAMGK